jgi:hypothetical protein
MMTLLEWTEGTGMRAALAAVTLGLVLCVWTTTRALHRDVVAAAAASVTVVAGALDAAPEPPPVDIAAAVSEGLFSPDRTAPEVRYRMPGEAVAATHAPAADAAVPVVLGTALALDGSSFATCQFQSDRLRMVRVGDTIGTYHVKSIERGRVVFTTAAGKQLEVLALRPGS